MNNMSFVKRISFAGMIVAVSVIIEFLHFPILPQAPFLEYDAAGVTLLIGAVILGPLYGIILSFITAGLHVFLGGNSGIYGFLMNGVALAVFVASASLVLTLISKKKNGLESETATHNKIIHYIIASLTGILLTTAVMLPLNIVLTPLFLGQPVDVVKTMLLFPILPFNLIKWSINAVISFIVIGILSKAKLINKALK